MFDAGGYLYEFDYLNHTNSIRILFYSLIIFTIVILLCFKARLSLYVSILIASLKSIIFFTYFFFFYNSDYHFYDDIVYFAVTRDNLLSYGILDYVNNIDNIKSLIGTNHIGFWSLVFLSLKIFGTYYYSVVLVNIILTSFASYFFYLTFLKLNFRHIFCQLFFAFSLIHWDVISWSTFLISKEPLIYFLLSFLFYNLVTLYAERTIKLKNLILIILCLLLISELRTYVFIFVTIISSAYIMFLVKIPNRIFLKSAVFSLPVIILFTFSYLNYSFIYQNLAGAFALLEPNMAQMNQIPFNMLKTLLTPLPMNIQPNYGFLFLTSIFHLIFIAIVPFGLFLSFNKTHKGLMPYLVFFISILVFYSFFQELAGPRQRFQYSMVLMYWQFLPIFKLFISNKITN